MDAVEDKLKVRKSFAQLVFYFAKNVIKDPYPLKNGIGGGAGSRTEISF